MEFDDLICTLCMTQFDRDKHIPLIIPKCGHTFCSKCLQDSISQISPEEEFVCPEDKVSLKISTQDLSQFPQNQSLLRLLDKRLSLSNIDKQNELSFKEIDFVVPKEFKSFSDPSTISTQEFSSPLVSPRGHVKNGSSFRNSFNHPDIFSFLQGDTNICKEHGKKLEIVCLEDRCRICANCALFGSHKNHEIKSEEEVFREIASKAEKLITVFQAIEISQSSEVEKETIAKDSEKIKKKSEEINRFVRQTFNEYVAALRTKEKQILKEISDKFAKMEEKFNQMRQLSSDSQDKIRQWKTRAHDTLVIVTEKSEKGEIAFELLDDRTYTKADLLSLGEKILQDLEKANEIKSKILDNTLSNSMISLDETFIRKIEALGRFELPDLSLPSTDVLYNNNVSHSIRNNENLLKPPLNEITNNNTLSNKSPRRSMSDMYESAVYIDLQDQSSQTRSLHNDTFSRSDSHSHFQTPSHKTTAFLPLGSGEDQNLLDFGWDAFQSVPSGLDSTPLGHFESGHQRKRSEGLYSLQNLGEGFRDENHGHQTTTHKRKNSGFLSVPKSMTEFPIERGNMNEGKKSAVAMGMTSPWKKGEIEQGMKTAVKSKKKSAIKVADKFSGTVTGIEQNVVESADLTHAEIGDQGIMTLAEYLKENTTLKSLKLLKNKISDEGGVALAQVLYYNKTLQSLNLTQNQLTEKTLDAFIEVIKSRKLVKLKSLYLSQNNMNLRNLKPKIKELAEFGVNAVL